MKNKINLLVIGILLVGVLVSAGIGIIQEDKNVELSKEAKTWYDNAGISISYEDKTNGQRCLISNTEFNLPCSDTNMTETELDAWQIQRLEGIAQVQIERANRVESEIKQEGEITINEK